MQYRLGSPGRSRSPQRPIPVDRPARPAARSTEQPSRSTLPAPAAGILTITRFRGVQEVAVVGIATFLYFFVRGLMHGQEVRAFENAERLIAFERTLGIFWELHFQDWALRYELIGTLANWVYIWGHWPVIIGTLVWLLTGHREQYAVYRNALLISGAIGLIFFTLFPMAPPRFMVDWGFVDTITLHSNSYRVLQPPSLVNQYAAMPSLHAGWDLLMGIAIVSHASRRAVRTIGYVLPVLMVLAIVLTANHYFMDAVVGGAVALVGLVAARWFRHGRPGSPTAPARRAPRRQVAYGLGD